MRCIRLTHSLAFFILTYIGYISYASQNSPHFIDTQPVLQIGSINISQYLLEKNHTRFLRSRTESDAPTENETKEWIENFLTKQVITAKAIELGYDKKPSVIENVDTMENHMLAQLSVQVEEPTEDELRSAYQELAFPPEEDSPTFERYRSTLSQRVLKRKQIEAKQQINVQTAQSINLNTNRQTAASLLKAISVTSFTDSLVPRSISETFASSSLVTFDLDDVRHEWTVRDWSERFNKLYLRRIPTDLDQLESSITNLVVNETLARDARKTGINEQTKFVEDRRNFLYNQAVDLFEREVLIPQIDTSTSALEAFYIENRESFAQPIRAEGHLYTFPSLDAALDYLRNGQLRHISNPEPISISMDSLFQNSPNTTRHILQMNTGERLGPFEGPNGPIVFKKTNAEFETPPFDLIAIGIKEVIIRSKLESLERELAYKWSNDFNIQDSLNLASIGIDFKIKKPWSL